MRRFLPFLIVAAVTTVACLVSPQQHGPPPGAESRTTEPNGRESVVMKPAGAARDASVASTALASEPSVAVQADAAIFPMGRFQSALGFDSTIFDSSTASRQLAAFDPQVSVEGNLDRPLTAVRFEGNAAISAEELLKLVKIQPGNVPDLTEIKNDLRALYATGKFADVTGRIEQSPPGPVLVLSVSERPLLQKITFVGSKSFDDDLLKEMAELKTGTVYDVEANQESCNMIQEVLHALGYPNAKVELVKGGSSDDREVIFNIEEGAKPISVTISITGNTSIPDDVLRSRLKNVAQGYKFLGDDCCEYCDATILSAVGDLKSYYRNMGFMNVKVKDVKSYSDDFSMAKVEYVITEGVRHRIRNIEFAGNNTLSARQLRENLKSRPGENYSRQLVELDKIQVAAQYGESGRLFAKVNARPRPLKKSGLVDLVFDIDEGRVSSIDAASSQSRPDDAGATSSIELASHEVAAPSARIAEPSALREINNLVFTGVKSFDEADIRESLGVDFDLHLAAHPQSDMFQYMKTLEAVMLSGYRHGGFPEAIVEILFNNTRRQIEVHVTEGPRVYCGDVDVSGENNIATAAIIRKLADAERPRRTVWKKGGPAPLDDEAVARIRGKIETEFADAGFFHPEFDVAIDRQPAATTASLKIAIKSEGPRAVVGNIEVTGSQRDSADDVLTHLDLRTGSPFTANSTWRLERRLSESGRYLIHQVKEQVAAKGADGGHEVHDLKIRLRDYKHARPLAQELLPAEQALVKLSQWLKRWSKGEIDEDLVVTASSESESADERPASGAASRQIQFRMIVSPQHGQSISLKVKSPEGVPSVNAIFAVFPDKLVLASAERKVKLVLPYSSENRLLLKILGESASEKSYDRDGFPFRLNVGMGVGMNKKATASVFDVRVDFTAASITSWAHQNDTKCELRDGTWHIRNDGSEIQIDAESGRLVEYRLALGELEKGLPTVVCRPRQQALKFELQALDQSLADLPTAYDATSPWMAISAFLADEMLALAGAEPASEQAASLRALRKLIGHWSPPGIDRLFDADSGNSSKKSEPFWLPSQRAGWNYDDLFVTGAPGRKNLIGDFLSIYRRFVPATGWMWTVGRDAALGWGASETPAGARLRQAPKWLEIGPAGELCLGCLGDYLNVDLSAAAGRAGMRRLAAEAFAKDYRPLLEGDSWAGQWLLSLATALRHLDDSELAALVRLLPENFPRETIVNSLTLLKYNPDKPVAEVLPAVLDHLWNEALRLDAEFVFLDWLRTEILKSEKKELDHVSPASAEDDDDEDLDILDSLGKPTTGTGKSRAKMWKEFPERTKVPDEEIPAIEEFPALLPDAVRTDLKDAHKRNGRTPPQ